MKKTFFALSLDSASAFDVLNREIQKRELYFAGEKGDFWKTSMFEYENSLTKIKRNGKLSSEIKESLGCKQGNVKSSDHFKIYTSPALEAIDNSDLGEWIGPIHSGVSCCADDQLLMSDDQYKLQGMLNIASHYGNMYRVQYGSSKTKVTVHGPPVDQRYYADILPWKMDSEKVKVVENNEHLGQIVSGDNQIQKNIDLRLNKGRTSLFGLLGSGFQ